MVLNNKTLAYMVIVIVIISVFGTSFAIIQFNKLTHPDSLFVTAKVPHDFTGNVSITIKSELSITTFDDSVINFPGCYPNRTIYSDTLEGDGLGACPNFVYDSIVVRNDGDVPANVTINFSDWGEVHGGNFINSSDNSSWLAFRLSNNSTHPSYGGGCLGFLQNTWVNATGAELVVCDELRKHNVNNSIEFFIAVHIPENVTGGTASTTLSFFASESGI